MILYTESINHNLIHLFLIMGKSLTIENVWRIRALLWYFIMTNQSINVKDDRLTQPRD